jgi:hypothetical protein
MQATETTAPFASAGRRRLLGMATAVAGASILAGRAHAQQSAGTQAAGTAANTQTGPLRRGLIGYMLSHEQFPISQLIRYGAMASQAGFHLLATSDHLQPWQANEGHAGEAWVTLAALGGHTSIVNVHSGQPDQERVIEFYARNVLPHFRQPSVSVGQIRSVSPG